jgi:hypothetical protein
MTIEPQHALTRTRVHVMPPLPAPRPRGTSLTFAETGRIESALMRQVGRAPLPPKVKPTAAPPQPDPVAIWFDALPHERFTADQARKAWGVSQAEAQARMAKLSAGNWIEGIGRDRQGRGIWQRAGQQMALF